MKSYPRSKKELPVVVTAEVLQSVADGMIKQPKGEKKTKRSKE